MLPTSLGEGPFAVATQGLTKRYAREPALNGVDLQIPEGAVYVLAGPNGAGKSTLIRSLLGLARPDAGRATVLGLDPRTSGPEVRARTGYVPEGAGGAYGWMRVGRLLQHHAAYYATWDRDYAGRLSRALDVRPERRVGALSKGQVRRLQLVLALAHRPSLLLLDEPTDGLDPAARDEALGLLSEHLADTGGSVLISTHLPHEVDGLADHLGVLRGGRLVAQAPRERLERMLRVYRAEGPDGWVGPEDLSGVIDRRAGVGRELRWTVWGEEGEVVARIAASGGAVRDVARLPFEDSVLALLRAKEAS
ncbi:ABC transporter ATP-binding protein [Caulobacter sp. 17J80-11]|uniref:ABC transporter ATP-binding protein n=1 Tax=Caulobacter sp. 17J80-11 TaxID=2763502 RepID=UPI001653B52B|nr:ABC transporter ATP-binding protein [Caulobacter sp. 17J80-11]MBC6983357.1 ABC transporter ATP-binding protein [Caulobacter sp. 17J80-11]